MKISSCIIVKNEEINIAKCLSSLVPFSDQIVLVDTGSNDRTYEIATSFNAQIFKFEWIDDFSAARNFAIDHSIGDWVVFIDADEFIEVDKTFLKSFLENEKKDAILCGFHNLEFDKDFPYASNKVVRIFRNTPLIRYKRSIHEYLYKEESELLYTDASSKIKVFHSGYNPSEIKTKNKYWRNLSLLINELKKDPSDSEINFYLADTYRIGNEHIKALFHIDLALKNNNFRDKEYRPLTLVCQILLMKESNMFKFSDLLKKTEDSLASYPNRPELLALKAILLRSDGEFSESKELFNRSLKEYNETPPKISYYSEIYKIFKATK